MGDEKSSGEVEVRIDDDGDWKRVARIGTEDGLWRARLEIPSETETCCVLV